MPAMTQIFLDTDLSHKLHGLIQVVEFRDPEGRVLGHFIPADAIAAWEPVTPEVSETERDRCEQSDEWLTTDEVIA
jgi:hypothetical protein